jgi:hypothetical protein
VAVVEKQMKSIAVDKGDHSAEAMLARGWQRSSISFLLQHFAQLLTKNYHIFGEVVIQCRKVQLVALYLG